MATEKSAAVAVPILTDERAKFSEWAKSENFNTFWLSHAKAFASRDTQAAWKVWQAVSRSQPQGEPAPYEHDCGNPACKGCYSVDEVAASLLAQEGAKKGCGDSLNLGGSEVKDGGATEASEDAARLDWLEKQFKTCTVYMDGQHPYSPNAKLRNLRGATFREAIDAARSAMAPQDSAKVDAKGEGK